MHSRNFHVLLTLFECIIVLDINRAHLCADIFSAEMQREMIEITKKGLTRAQLEAPKNHKTRKNVENLKRKR